MDSTFFDVLILKFPTILPEGRGTAPKVLWFSKTYRNGQEHVVCVSLVTDMVQGVPIYAHNTEAIVIGGGSMVGKTLLVSALSITATTNAPEIADPASLPAFHSTVWPALIVGGVVSSPLLAVTQPDIHVFDASFRRDRPCRDAPVEVRFRVVPREGDKPSVYDAVVVRGVTLDVGFGQFNVAVRDVCVASDIALVGAVDYNPSLPTQWSSGPTAMTVNLFGDRPCAVIAFKVRP